VGCLGVVGGPLGLGLSLDQLRLERDGAGDDLRWGEVRLGGRDGGRAAHTAVICTESGVPISIVPWKWSRPKAPAASSACTVLWVISMVMSRR